MATLIKRIHPSAFLLAAQLLPVTTTGRVLLMLEQFVGVGYVAVVISRLVGLTIQRHGSNA